MELGAVVDYIAEWNEIHKAELAPSGSGGSQEEERRWATQADWDALLG